MKKTTANRRKKLPLLLGTLLIVSVAAYGTRAYFSDSATQQGNIALELGTVEISAPNSENWRYQPVQVGTNDVNTELKSRDKKLNLVNGGEILEELTITNVRPGDSFIRKYSFKNTGSLPVKLELDQKSFTGTEVFVTNINELAKGDIIEPGNSAEYDVTITVPTNLDTKLYNNNNKPHPNLDPNKLTIDYLGDNITVKAFQTNAEESTTVE